MRDSMIIYRSFVESVRELDKESQADLWMAIFEYGMDGKKPTLSGIPKSLFCLMQPVLDKGRTNFENGSKQKRNRSEQQAKQKRNGSQQEAYKDKDKDKDKDVDKETGDKSPPKGSPSLFTREYFETQLAVVPGMSEDEKREFTDYWLEQSPGKKKSRAAYEKTFDIRLRAATWMRNRKKWDHGARHNGADLPDHI